MLSSTHHLSLISESTAAPHREHQDEFDALGASPWSVLAEGDATWRLDALCAETDPEAFFPEKGGSTREAKRVCAGCDVRTECLEFALANDERFGIWGGLSERERRRVRLARRTTPLGTEQAAPQPAVAQPAAPRPSTSQPLSA